jgi:menin
MSVAALVSAMNPSINANQDSEELAILQQQLLWILYDNNHLSQYPMAIGNLGDLEDIFPSLTPRKSPIELFYEAINVAKKTYADSHVYPYTYLAGYLYRNGRFKEALQTWADGLSHNSLIN